MCICVCALTPLSDVCIPAVVEQEAGLGEVKNMVLLMLHLLAEPYSESCNVVEWSVPFIYWENLLCISLLMCTTDHVACGLIIQLFFLFADHKFSNFETVNYKFESGAWYVFSHFCRGQIFVVNKQSVYCLCEQWEVSLLLLLTKKSFVENICRVFSL